MQGPFVELAVLKCIMAIANVSCRALLQAPTNVGYSAQDFYERRVDEQSADKFGNYQSTTHFAKKPIDATCNKVKPKALERDACFQRLTLRIC
ncbi:hypothetical protein M514_09667 [Trichuris suis]|uniref:Uncharacterized protein n=1 Tax=Trichuris suis TaxID=68888 RepID=A0A085LWY6_9BILA|nr:hypothetical protein M513_09667 [Trichuris suis]KFD69750.1 hypothetical protein M514_09667 [Trichuris suis]